jgi:hypothetical protein
VVSLAPPSPLWTPPLSVCSKPTTRMSPAGIPCAFTVTELPFADAPVSTAICPSGGTAGAGSEAIDGQPGATGTTTTRSSPT